MTLNRTDHTVPQQPANENWTLSGLYRTLIRACFSLLFLTLRDFFGLKCPLLMAEKAFM